MKPLMHSANAAIQLPWPSLRAIWVGICSSYPAAGARRVDQGPRLPRLTQLNKLPNVELYPESDLTAEQILEFGYDHVALATGAHWRHDGVGRRHARPIPRNDHSIVLSPDDVMNGQVIDGPIVIFDDDHYFMGGALAELLAKQGAPSPW